MIRISKEHFDSIAKLLTDCFMEDQLVIKQTKGIENPKEFLHNLFFLQIHVFHKTCEMYCLDDNLNSVIIGYEKNKYKPLKVLILSILSQFKLSRLLKSSDFKLYSQNLKDTSKSINLKWQKEFIKGNYYRLEVIAIAENNRKKGIFRALITPIIDYCKEISIPIVLETTTPENVPIYQHFGFELVKTIPEKGTGFCQYCFIKQP
ncbi:GNAT family N-acetyltransferase [Anaerocolumna sedimenticola]|uniref:GNAT family N-acetyltransferase n=1 Tax=Anaerocolumna sedimenticola TaxID=2696063 RepID=A0A6P1TSB8_9FIRM|nr:GNAT family N-acetyltransferase [Anaerocolumna sedimenticola]QHQ62636.1 GNAT family N-acetyltransferase [Anaerocolumna sedimenticola]